MKIGIRADGGTEIGMGHIMRTLVLAKELKKRNHQVYYICKIELLNIVARDIELYNRPFNEIEELDISTRYKMGIEKVILENFKVYFVRENYLFEDISEVSLDFLITDSYDVDENYFNKTKAMFNKTAYIDDMNLYYFDVDFLLNQNADAEDFKYRVNNDTKLILGTKYVLMREEFRDLHVKNIKIKVHDIMLTVGGSDPFNLTDKILSWVKDLDYNFHVVVGPSFEYSEKLKKHENNKIKLYYNANMHMLMEKCDMAISACGSTLYELAACGVPTIGIVIADNQLGIAGKLDDIGIIKNLGWYNKLNGKDLIYHLNELANNYDLRKSISQKSCKIVDGKGLARVVSIFTENI